MQAQTGCSYLQSTGIMLRLPSMSLHKLAAIVTAVSIQKVAVTVQFQGAYQTWRPCSLWLYWTVGIMS